MEGSKIGGILGIVATMIALMFIPTQECKYACGSIPDTQTIWILVSLAVGAAVAVISWKVLED